MTTRLAEFHAEALDLADAEAFADEAVDIHIAHGHLSSSRARLQPDVLHNLGGNERQRLARGSPVGVEMTVALESLPGDRPHRLDSPQLGLAGSPEMNRLHWHRPIMHQPSVEGFVRGVIPEHWPRRASVIRRRCAYRHQTVLEPARVLRDLGHRVDAEVAAFLDLDDAARYMGGQPSAVPRRHEYVG
jgi:hypothetical protein